MDWTAALLAEADGQDERQSGAAQHREREMRSISSAGLLKKSKKSRKKMRSISSAVLLKRSKKSRRKCEAFRVPAYLRKVRRNINFKIRRDIQ